MPRILIVENDNSYARKLSRTLKERLKETSAISFITPVDESEARELLQSQHIQEDVELVLVDLELDPMKTPGTPLDYLGRDVVLQEIRRCASWIPTILVSGHVTDPIVLARTTPYDFDAIIPKDYFDSPLIDYKHWFELKRKAAMRRVGTLTGRPTTQLGPLLDCADQMVVDYGETVRRSLEELGLIDVLRDILALAGLRGEIIGLDEMPQGCSGLLATKARITVRGREVVWFLKLGRDISKLASEVAAHRKMFEDGLTRRLTVPCLWWAPVVWKSVGLIAYEFEKESLTLLEKARDNLSEALDTVGGLFDEFYYGGRWQTRVPRKILTRLVEDEDAVPGVKATGLVKKLLQREEDRALDKPARIKASCQHGDLNARNILVSDRGPVLIDFSHYVEVGQGFPLLDLAKLCVDLWVHAQQLGPLRMLTNGEVLKGSLDAILDPFLGDPAIGVTDDEKRFFGLAVHCYLYKYANYSDTTPELRDQILQIL